MSAAVYASDLVDILLEMASTTGWTALGGGASGLVAPETDFFIQGANCISKAGWSTATKGMIYSAGAQSIPSGKALFIWALFWAPNSLQTEANGGLQVLIGSSASAFKQWYVGGSDSLPFGGWLLGVVDPTIAADATTGSPSSTTSFFGAQANVPSAGPSKGQPLGIDAIRYGRELQITNGDLANGYATFAGAAAYDNNNSRKWGLLILKDGAFYQLGLFLMGSASTAVDFRDSNRVIFIQNIKKVGSGFNAFEVRNASSRVDWTNISIQALGTVSRGNFIVTDNADVNLLNCSFTDLGTFNFLSNSSSDGCTFRNCNLITVGGSTFSNCKFFGTNDSAKAMITASLAVISNCSFTSGGTKHAIEVTTPGTYSFTGNSFSGYGADGTTNAAIYNNSGGLVTINISGGSTPTVRNGAGASTVINNTLQLTLTGLISGSDIVILDAGTTTERVNVDANSGSTYVFSYTTGGNVDICVYLHGYVPFIIRNFTLPASNGSIPISQVADRNFTP